MKKQFWFIIICCWFNSLAAQTVTATWEANTEKDLAGYRVHYGAASRVYTTHLPAASTSLRIDNLTSGKKYFFAVTAFDSAGNESDYSNEASITIPPQISTGRDTTILPESNLFSVSLGASKSTLGGKKILALWGLLNNGKAWARLDFLTADTLEIEVSARGESALNVWPRLEIAVGDTHNVIQSASITSTTFQPFVFKNIIPRNQPLYFIFPNDAWLEGAYDRNLFIESMRLKGIAATPLPPVFSKYDMNQDGKVDVFDWIFLLRHIGLQQGHADYKSGLDLNNDGWIDGFDKSIFARLSI